MEIWAIWLSLIVLSFIALEAWKIRTGGVTLSRFVWNVSKAFPPFGWFAGFLTGFLVCHFWWGGIVTF